MKTTSQSKCWKRFASLAREKLVLLAMCATVAESTRAGLNPPDLVQYGEDYGTHPSYRDVMFRDVAVIWEGGREKYSASTTGHPQMCWWAEKFNRTLDIPLDVGEATISFQITIRTNLYFELERIEDKLKMVHFAEIGGRLVEVTEGKRWLLRFVAYGGGLMPATDESALNTLRISNPSVRGDNAVFVGAQINDNKGPTLRFQTAGDKGQIISIVFPDWYAVADRSRWKEIRVIAVSSPIALPIILGNRFYENGDYESAFAQYLQAATNGNVLGQLNVGVMYRNGKGVKQDFTEAANWLRKAAAGGNAEAQYKLGLMHSKGEGVPQSANEAQKWYRKAAEAGWPDALRSLKETPPSSDGAGQTETNVPTSTRSMGTLLPAEDTVVAKGKGVLVTRRELYKEYVRTKAGLAMQGRSVPDDSSAFGRQVLDALIVRQLLLGKSIDEDKIKGKEQFEAGFQKAKTEGRVTEEEFNQRLNSSLHASGMSKEEWEEQGIEQATLPIILERELKIEITDERVRKFRNENPTKANISESNIKEYLRQSEIQKQFQNYIQILRNEADVQIVGVTALAEATSDTVSATNRGGSPPSIAKKPASSIALHTDRNRYFTCLYPAGWRQKDFPGETVRSKVEFINPTKSDLSIRIIVAPTSRPSVTTDSYYQELNEKLPRLRSMAPGIAWSAQKGTVAGREAVIQTGSGSGLEQRIVNYIHEGFQYSIALNALTKQDFSAAESMFNRLLSSLTLDGGSKAMTEAERKAAQVARFKRLAILCEETGQRADALSFVKEGMEIDAQNEDLKAIERRLSSQR